MDKINHILQFDIRSARKSILILLTFYFVFGLYYGFSIGDLSVIPITVMIWATMLIGLPFQLNEKYGLNHLMGTFPVKRKSIIAGRYLYSLLFGAIGLSMSEILICILAGFFQIELSRKQIYLSLCVAIFLYVVIASIYLPLYFLLTHIGLLYISPVLASVAAHITSAVK
jgi:ABC-2 type transport system permease protein